MIPRAPQDHLRDQAARKRKLWALQALINIQGAIKGFLCFLSQATKTSFFLESSNGQVKNTECQQRSAKRRPASGAPRLARRALPAARRLPCAVPRAALWAEACLGAGLAAAGVGAQFIRDTRRPNIFLSLQMLLNMDSKPTALRSISYFLAALHHDWHRGRVCVLVLFVFYRRARPLFPCLIGF